MPANSSRFEPTSSSGGWTSASPLLRSIAKAANITPATRAVTPHTQTTERRPLQFCCGLATFKTEVVNSGLLGNRGSQKRECLRGWELGTQVDITRRAVPPAVTQFQGEAAL